MTLLNYLELEALLKKDTSNKVSEEGLHTLRIIDDDTSLTNPLSLRRVRFDL